MAEINLSGMDSLLSRLEGMANNTANSITNAALKAAAIPVLADAKNTSVFADRTGKLREGLKIGSVKTKNGIKYIEIGIDKGDNSKIFYGKFIEWGTSTKPARPFLQPSLEKNKSSIKEIITEELRRGLGL